jgi:hypothetical protein
MGSQEAQSIQQTFIKHLLLNRVMRLYLENTQHTHTHTHTHTHDAQNKTKTGLVEWLLW